MKNWTILFIVLSINAFLLLQLTQFSKSFSPSNTLTGLECVTDRQFLPLIEKNHFGSMKELEPNNVPLHANGPLQSRQVYSGTLSGQGNQPEFDYYKFYVYQPGQLQIRFIDPHSQNGKNLEDNYVQFKLYNVGSQYRDLDLQKDLVKNTYRASEPYNIITNTLLLQTEANLDASEGWFVIRIAYIPDNAQDPIINYILELDYPVRPPSPISSPIPFCTPTPTPTSTLTPTSTSTSSSTLTPTPTPTPFPTLHAQCDNVYLSPAYGSYVIVFDGEKINRGGKTKRFYITIPPGIYDVYLASFDETHEIGLPDEQKHEIWKLLFYNNVEQYITESGLINDLDEGKCTEELVNHGLVISETVNYVVGEHGLPAASDPQSISPFYAILEPIQLTPPSETATETPTPTNN